MAEELNNDLVREYRLPQGRMMRIQRALGWLLHCDEGAIHVTQQGDSRDIVVRAGGAIALNTNGRVVLDAHGDARLRLAPPMARRSAWTGAVVASRPAVAPVVRLLAARRHGTPIDGLPLTYDQVFRDPGKLEQLVARAHIERSEAIAAAFAALMPALVRGMVRALQGLRLQLPS